LYELYLTALCHDGSVDLIWARRSGERRRQGREDIKQEAEASQGGT
jgi:hypothetical protein